MARTEKARRRKRLARKVGTKTRKKLAGLFIAVVLALVALGGRITYINATRGDKYERTVLSQAQQQYDSRVIPFRRGDILDRNGTILATSEKVYNVVLDCKVVNTEVKDIDGTVDTPYIEPTVSALVKLLGLNEADIRKRLTDEETRESQYQILKKNMSIADKKAFENYVDLTSDENFGISAEEAEQREMVKGVWFEEVYNRVYPQNSLACDLIGFTYDGTTADWGIEGYYSDILNGVNGRQYGYFNTDADVEQTIIPAVDGKTVALTVDINIQHIIRDALEAYEAEYSSEPGKYDGAANLGVIVMDPNTGAILGMDSNHWYDLNNPRDLSPYYDEEELKEMSNSEEMDALNNMWRNYCVSDAFEPGSTFKPITASAALSSGAITADDEFFCDGYQQVADWKIRCAIYPAGHGDQKVSDALVHSCNDAFMQIGEKLGAPDFLRYQSTYHFGKKTGIDLPGENAGIIFNEDTMGVTQLATTAFGQGFTCTMIQEAAAFAAVINGGKYYKPYVVREIQNDSGAVMKATEPILESRVISQEVSDTVRRALGGVVEEGGTGTDAKVEGYTMGGKTGTAEKLPRDNGKYLLSFVGFAPLENPEVLVYVVVDEPNRPSQENSWYVADLARHIMENLFPYLGLFPDEAGYVPTEPQPEPEYGVPSEDITTSTEDGALVEPPEEVYDETVYEGGNDLFTEGITNQDQELMEEWG